MTQARQKGVRKVNEMKIKVCETNGDHQGYIEWIQKFDFGNLLVEDRRTNERRRKIFTDLLTETSRTSYGSASAWIFFTETIFFHKFQVILRYQPLIKCANITSICFIFPFTFLCLFMPFFIFYFFVVDKGVSLAPTYSSIVIRKLDLRSSLRIECWLRCFYPFCQDILWPNKKSFKALDHLNDLWFFWKERNIKALDH